MGHTCCVRGTWSTPAKRARHRTVVRVVSLTTDGFWLSRNAQFPLPYFAPQGGENERAAHAKYAFRTQANNDTLPL